LAALKADKIELFYLHAPDRSTPFEVTFKAVDELHKEGKFDKVRAVVMLIGHSPQSANVCCPAWYFELHGVCSTIGPGTAMTSFCFAGGKLQK
jgi:hypothetical protein